MTTPIELLILIEKAGTGIERIRDEAREGAIPSASGRPTALSRPSSLPVPRSGRQWRRRQRTSTRQVTHKSPDKRPHMYRTSPGHVAVLEASQDPHPHLCRW